MRGGGGGKGGGRCRGSGVGCGEGECGGAGGERRKRGTPGHLSLSTLRARRTDSHVPSVTHRRSTQFRDRPLNSSLPNAPYVHCKSHNINLVVTESCKNIRQVRNLMASVG